MGSSKLASLQPRTSYEESPLAPPKDSPARQDERGDLLCCVHSLPRQRHPYPRTCSFPTARPPNSCEPSTTQGGWQERGEISARLGGSSLIENMIWLRTSSTRDPLDKEMQFLSVPVRTGGPDRQCEGDRRKKFPGTTTSTAASGGHLTRRMASPCSSTLPSSRHARVVFGPLLHALLIAGPCLVPRRRMLCLESTIGVLCSVPLSHGVALSLEQTSSTL